ncbi:hypothetical protein [Sphingosinicella sp. BN140058]|uniref:hypothetical protein n=1 Tax=Sphingosinicella sp. BN140058 TaxID=1892855 RepID=UPI0013EA846E|nr:hypothetical protein [Sphingosinicella sp. BN140058]
MIVSRHALPTSMPFRHHMMVLAAASRTHHRPAAAKTKAEQYDAHIDALIDQNYGYVRPWWDVYGDAPTPSETELGTVVRHSDNPEAVRFRSHYQ